VHLARIRACDAWTNMESARVVRDAHSQLAKGFPYVLFRDASLQAIALRVANGSLYHNRPLRVYPCSNSRTVQVKKPRHNASARSQSESESAAAAAAANKKPRHEKKNDNKPTTTLSTGKELLQSAAAAHRNSIAKGALKRLLAKELKQDAVAQQQKKRRARGNTPPQKAKAKTATSAPK